MLVRSITLIMLMMMSTAMAATTEFKEGVDFQRIPGVKTTTTQKKVVVQEFFSYGCPWCYRFEPKLKGWLKTKPANVEFQRIPVVFNPTWENYARVYYTLEAMGISDTAGSALFSAVQDKHQQFRSLEDFVSFFKDKNVDTKTFASIYSGSPGLQAKLSQGKQLLKQYRVWGVPCVVVNGTYLTDSRLTKGDSERMIAVVKYLVAHSQENKAKQ